MANVIIVWEYERDYTHINRLKQLQKSLTALGHQTYLIGSNLPTIEEENVLPFLPAPRASLPSIHKSRAVTKIGSFGDRIALLGFNDAKILYTLATAWDNIFALLKPDLIISDCAPVANLAAYGTIPCMQMSDGLSIPPHHLNDFPRLRPDAPPLAATREMFNNVCYVQTRRKKKLPPSLPAILESQGNFICHLPDFDPYFTFRNNNPQFGTCIDLPSYPCTSEKKHFFAYLDKSYPDIEEVVISFMDLDKQGIFFIPGAAYAMQQYIKQSGMLVCDQMPKLSEILPQCAWAIHHGNITIAEAALAAGIPQFNLPMHFESDWISNYLVELGVSISIYPKIHPITNTLVKIKTALQVQEAYQQYSLREWAALRAQHLKQKNHVSIEPLVIAACQAILQ